MRHAVGIAATVASSRERRASGRGRACWSARGAADDVNEGKRSPLAPRPSPPTSPPWPPSWWPRTHTSIASILLWRSPPLAWWGWRVRRSRVNPSRDASCRGERQDRAPPFKFVSVDETRL